MKKLGITAAAVVFAAALTIGAGAPAFAATAPSIEQLPSTTSGATPIVTTVVVIDPATGKILSESRVSGPVPDISIVGPGCSTTSVCLKSPSVPFYGFQYSGTLNGSWAGRTNYYTGEWTTRLHWTYEGSSVTGPELGPDITGTFSGATVTVTQVRIY